MKFEIDGATYQIEFQHHNKRKKNTRLGYVQGFQAMTTCVVVSPKAVSIGTAFCSESDRFSKEEGRIRALLTALYHNPDVGYEAWVLDEQMSTLQPRKCFDSEARQIMYKYLNRPKKVKAAKRVPPRKWTAEEIQAARDKAAQK